MSEPPEAEQLNPDAFQEFLETSRSDGDGPIVMLNLIALKPDGGLEKYMEYGDAVAPILEGVGGKPVFMGNGNSALIGAGDRKWDLVLLVEYPSRAAFLEMIGSPEYQAIAHLRTEALDGLGAAPARPGRLRLSRRRGRRPPAGLRRRRARARPRARR